jgi:hypothetical protein
MVTTLSKLVDMIQSGAVPAWLRDEVIAHRDQITNALLENGVYALHGPSGEIIEVWTEKQVAAA